MKRSLAAIDEDIGKGEKDVDVMNTALKRLKTERDEHPDVVAAHIPSFLRGTLVGCSEFRVQVDDGWDTHGIWEGKVFSCQVKIDGIGGRFRAWYNTNERQWCSARSIYSPLRFWVPSKDEFRGTTKLTLDDTADDVGDDDVTLWDVCLARNNDNTLYALVSLALILATRCGDKYPLGFCEDIHDDDGDVEVQQDLDDCYRRLCALHGLACELAPKKVDLIHL